MAQKDIGHKVPLHTLKTTGEVEAFYDGWADNGKYNRDMQDWNYTGPQECVGVLSDYLTDTQASILDAGCGSGLVGEALHERGYTCIDGVDLSNKLLDAVPNEIYQTLFQADLNYSLDVPDSYYDAVICVGTFTYGHVKADALAEFIRITNHEGFICFTVNEGIFVEEGFKAKLADLETEDRWVRRELLKSDYLASKNVNAWLGLYQVKKC